MAEHEGGHSRSRDIISLEREQVGDARPLLGRVMRTPPVMHPYEPLLDRAVDISSQTRAGLYDCLYAVLAEREGCELVTEDQKLIANLKPHFPFIVPLASLP